MKNKAAVSTITASELEIIQVLWAEGKCTSSKIVSVLSPNGERSGSTIKALLLRLVNKNAVDYDELSGHLFNYYPLVTKEEYINYKRKSYVQKLFDGSAQKMLLNFVQEENITKDDLKHLIDLIEDKEDGVSK